MAIKSSLGWLLLIVASLGVFVLVSPALALTENLIEVPSVRVHNTSTYLSATLDAGSYDTLVLSFNFDTTTLDFGPPQDSFSYGYIVNGGENVLGSISGLAGADPLELSTVSLNLPAEARASSLQIFMRVTANSAQSSDKAEITNLQLVGTKPDPIDVCPNLPEIQTLVPVGYHMEGEVCIVDTPPPVDVCLNLDGLQESLPAGYQVTGEGVCVLIPPLPIDVCPNLPEIQETLPIGYHLEGFDCVIDVLQPTDICPNLEGGQTTLPTGYHIEGGNCVLDVVSPIDVCPNLPEIQLTIPSGYMLVSLSCEPISAPTDTCLNLTGDQTTVPEGYVADKTKNCTLIPLPADVCLNLEGTQATLPSGYQVDTAGICTVVVLPIDLCFNIIGIQEVIPSRMVLNESLECVPQPVIEDDKPRKGGGGGKGTRINKFYQKNAGECPSGYARWIDRFRESHVWVADDVYQEVLLVGGPKPGQKNRDGGYFLKISGPTEVGDKYFRRFHKINFICVKG